MRDLVMVLGRPKEAKAELRGHTKVGVVVSFHPLFFASKEKGEIKNLNFGIKEGTEGINE